MTREDWVKREGGVLLRKFQLVLMEWGFDVLVSGGIPDDWVYEDGNAALEMAVGELLKRHSWVPRP